MKKNILFLTILCLCVIDSHVFFASTLAEYFVYIARDASAQQLQSYIDTGVDVNARDSEGYTALMSACQFGNSEGAKFLLEHGAHINMRTYNFMSALRLAVVDVHPAVVRLLIEYGADVNEKNPDGTTILMEACALKTRSAALAALRDIVEMLLVHHADVNAKNNGHTALMAAAITGNEEVVSLLLTYGADIDQRNSRAATAIELAHVNDHQDVVNILINHRNKSRKTYSSPNLSSPSPDLSLPLSYRKGIDNMGNNPRRRTARLTR